MLDNTHDKYIHFGGLKPIAKAYGIVGFIRFLNCYYLTLITKRAKVGSIGGNGIYSIKSTETYQIRSSEDDPKYQKSSTVTVNNSVNNSDRSERERTTSSDSQISSASDASKANASKANASKANASKANASTSAASNSAAMSGQSASLDAGSVLVSMWNKGKRSVGLGRDDREIAELRYQGLFQFIDLTKNFLFSYTYDLTNSLQHNMLSMMTKPFPPPPFKDMYAWNFFQTRELEACTGALTNSFWVLPIVFGAFLQRKVEVGGRQMNLSLIARRSRHFAGTRYLKRGLSDAGKVANDVEHEQIIHDESAAKIDAGNFSSFLQMRGSIPTYWTQETTLTMPKPPIVLNRVDPTYKATQLHFADLMKRYGSPVIILDLVKQSEKREREVIVGNEFRHAIEYLNCFMTNEHKLRYCALDYSHISKHRSLNVSKALDEVSIWAVNQTGFFCSSPRFKIDENGTVRDFEGSKEINYELGVPILPMEQKGILRTNCIDCLDRTNVAQCTTGITALAQQLVVMGIHSSTELDSNSEIVHVLVEMYGEIGDYIALQYGGSEAHKKVGPGKLGAGAAGSSAVQGPTMGKHKEFLTSIRRYYSNTFTDRVKQDAINLFLGYFIPREHSLPLWELENDYYLHNFHVQTGGRRSLQERSFSDSEDEERDSAEGGEGSEKLPKELGAMKKKTYKHRNVVRRSIHKVGKRVSRSRSPRPGDSAKTSRGLQSERIPEEGDGESEKRDSEKRDSEKRDSESTTTKVLKEKTARARKKCLQQAEKLQNWWRIALQGYLQQRMWMHLGQPSQTLLPSRFQRLYQPEKLTQFDKHFAHIWAAPSRLTHVKITNDETEEEDKDGGKEEGKKNRGENSQSNQVAGLVSSGSPPPTPNSSKNEGDEGIDVDGVVVEGKKVEEGDDFAGGTAGDSSPDMRRQINGDPLSRYFRKLGSRARSILGSKNSNSQGQGGRVRRSGEDLTGIKEEEGEGEGDEGNWSHQFLGNPNVQVGEVDEYANFVEYVKNIGDTSRVNELSYQEFKESLHEVNLNSDDVEGIRYLSESAHITKTLKEGIYEGLDHKVSAAEVAAVINGQFNTLGSMRERGKEEEGLEECMKVLDREGLGDSKGVMAQVVNGWENLKASEGLHKETLDPDSLKSLKSDSTSGETMELYCSFFSAESIIDDIPMRFIIGEEGKIGEKEKQKGGDEKGNSSSKKEQISGAFEQINDDLYARKKNKFMVFNGAGMNEWRDTHMTNIKRLCIEKAFEF